MNWYLVVVMVSFFFAGFLDYTNTMKGKPKLLIGGFIAGLIMSFTFPLVIAYAILNWCSEQNRKAK